MIGREREIRADAEIGFGDHRLGIGQRLVAIFAFQQGDAAQQRHVEHAGHLGGIAQPLVDLFQRQRGESGEHQPDQQRERKVEQEDR